MASLSLDLLLCDARKGDPVLSSFSLELKEGEPATVGLALVSEGIAMGRDDPSLSRKGSFGVFGKRKDWDSPIYSGDRLELYSPLLIDPKSVRRKKANQTKMLSSRLPQPKERLEEVSFKLNLSKFRLL